MAQILNPLRTYRTVKKRLIIIGATILVAMMVSFAFSGEMVAWVESSISQPAVFLRTDGSVVCLDQSFLSCGDPGESARHLLSVLEVYWNQRCSPRSNAGIPLFALAGTLFAFGLIFCNLVILRWSSISSSVFGMDHDVTP